MRLLFQICRKVSAGKVGPGSKTRPVAANRCGRIGKMRPRTLLYNRFRNHRSRRGKSEGGVSGRGGSGAGLPADSFGRSVAGQSPLLFPFVPEGRLPTADRLWNRFPGQGAVAGRAERPPEAEGYSGRGRLSFGADRKRAHRKGAPVSDSARRPLRYAHFTSAKSMRWGSLSFLGKMRMARSNEPVDSGVKRVE